MSGVQLQRCDRLLLCWLVMWVVQRCQFEGIVLVLWKPGWDGAGVGSRTWSSSSVVSFTILDPNAALHSFSPSWKVENICYFQPDRDDPID